MSSDVDGLGQNREHWQSYWSGRNPAYEISTIDNLALRPWILKYIPRYGTSLEAGCGLGRYVFYLSHLGIRIIGLEFEESLVLQLMNWAKEVELPNEFHVGDVRQLPYQDGSLSGYLSLGVVEHFQEGPMRPLLEAYRVLRPGGIAIVETPAPGYARRLIALKAILSRWRSAGGQLKRVHLREALTTLKSGFRSFQNLYGTRTVTDHHDEFWQYEYKSSALAHFVTDAGLQPIWVGQCDLRYNEYQLNRWQGERSRVLRRLQYLDRFETSPLVRFGAVSLVIAVKPGSQMCCFLCGHQKVNGYSGGIPICEQCQSTELSTYYRDHQRPRVSNRWGYEYQVDSNCERSDCSICGSTFQVNELFGDSGFQDRVCDACIQIPHVNIRLANERLKLTWRAPCY